MKHNTSYILIFIPYYYVEQVIISGILKFEVTSIHHVNFSKAHFNIIPFFFSSHLPIDIFIPFSNQNCARTSCFPTLLFFVLMYSLASDVLSWLRGSDLHRATHERHKAKGALESNPVAGRVNKIMSQTVSAGHQREIYPRNA
jgi:hypothetical protein